MMGGGKTFGPAAQFRAQQLGQRFIEAHKLSGLIGLNVVTPEEQEQLGEIEDLVIQPQTGTIAYGIISPGQGQQAEQRLVAVPWNSVQVNERRRVALLDAERQTLDQLAFRVGQYPDLTDQSYASRLHQQLGTAQRQAFGFVPEQQRVSQEPGWRQRSEYNQQFQENQIETIQGRIESTGVFYPDREAETPGLRLKVQTGDGRLATVHAGPVSLAQQQGMRFSYGQSIQVTGAKTQIDDRPVIMATEIQTGGQTLQVRSENGEPRWQQQFQQQQGQQQQQQQGQQQEIREYGPEQRY